MEVGASEDLGATGKPIISTETKEFKSKPQKAEIFSLELKGRKRHNKSLTDTNELKNMKINFPLINLFLIISAASFAQDSTAISEEIRVNQFVEGTLLKPTNIENPPLVIMIQGSGPTDRNGNQPFMKNDSFKKLANELAKEGIATFRYDKRISQMSQLNLKEEEMRFDDFVTDAGSAIDYFEDSPNFSKTIILGHSQGSLVAMLAARGKADALISIAGAAEPIDSIIVQQITAQMPHLEESVKDTFKEIRENGSTANYNPLLQSIFRPSVQPFIASWMKYNPKEELSGLDIPVLIINGTNDLQVGPAEAEKLAAANPKAELVLLEGMNHIFRKIEGSELENSKSYNEPGLPLHPQLLPTIVSFVKKQ